MSLWHYFITLPLVLRVAGLLGFGFVASCGWLKRKAIATAGRVVITAASTHFWGYVRKNVQAAQPSISNERIYKGVFFGCSQYPRYPREDFFTLAHDGVTTKVPIFKTNLLSGVQHGAFVEIDKHVVRGYKAEIVRRVRVQEKK